MKNLCASLLLLVVWSSTAAAQNSVSASKSCYILQEPIVATFRDVTPKIGDWVGLLPASANPNSSSTPYKSFVYTCGSAKCNSTAPVTGTLGIPTYGVGLGTYKLVLLRSPSTPLVVSNNFTISVSCAAAGPAATTDSATVDKKCYNKDEGIIVSFTDKSPQVGDRIGIIEAAADVNGVSVYYPAIINTCGTFTCKTAPPRGQVVIFSSLTPGAYKVVLLRGERLIALAVSANFNIVTTACAVAPTSPVRPTAPVRPPTPMPVRPTTPMPVRPTATSSISVGKMCYKQKQYVVVTFVDVGAQTGDRIGFIQSSANVNGGSVYYPLAIYTCGSNACTGAPASGTVNIYQILDFGSYKAVLLRGANLQPLAVSSNFDIASSCPGPAPTSAPGTFVVVRKSCFLSTEAVVATFADPGAPVGDRIGIISASTDVEVAAISYPSTIFTCGTHTCVGSPTSGTVSVYQSVPNGLYKAVLLRGDQLKALAVSSNFTITNSKCP